MSILRTYVVPRPFNGYNIPISIQSSYLKDYAKKNSLIFSLPETEITTSNSYSILCGILQNDTEVTDLAFTSIFVLPISDIEKIKKIFNNNVNKYIKLHFVLENKVFLIHEMLEFIKTIGPLKKLVFNYKSFLKTVS